MLCSRNYENFQQSYTPDQRKETKTKQLEKGNKKMYHENTNQKSLGTQNKGEKKISMP